MATTLHNTFTNLSLFTACPKPIIGVRRQVRCEVSVAEKNRQVILKNGNDSLQICRVLNGMWQTSGGWGRIDRDDAVESMLKYADAGLGTKKMVNRRWVGGGQVGDLDKSKIEIIILPTSTCKSRRRPAVIREIPPPETNTPRSVARSHQPSEGNNKVLSGVEITNEETESLNQRYRQAIL
ncbi:hypothetical protein AgCh_026020 [Apium graveolens]